MTSLIRTSGMVEAYANWSRWVAPCSFCRYGAKQLQPFTPTFECCECGTVTEVIWPPEHMVAGVERLLMMRPDPSTRNWLPGETLHDLMWENAAHGVLAQYDRPGPPGIALMVGPDRIQVDDLPILKPRIRREVTA